MLRRGHAAGRGTAGELPEVRARRGAGNHSGAGDGAGFCFSSFALLTLYFTVFSVFSVFLDRLSAARHFLKIGGNFAPCWLC